MRHLPRKPHKHVLALAGWIMGLALLAGAGFAGLAWALGTLGRALR